MYAIRSYYGNHSLVHPCSGNFEWARDKALGYLALHGSIPIAAFAIAAYARSRRMLDDMSVGPRTAGEQRRYSGDLGLVDHLLVAVITSYSIHYTKLYDIGFIEMNKPDHVAIFGSDHIYKMDVSQMLEFHKEKKAVLTVAAIRVPLKEASAFGVIEVDTEGRMIGFSEKPAYPKPIPGDPERLEAVRADRSLIPQAIVV